MISRETAKVLRSNTFAVENLFVTIKDNKPLFHKDIRQTTLRPETEQGCPLSPQTTGLSTVLPVFGLITADQTKRTGKATFTDI